MQTKWSRILWSWATGLTICALMPLASAADLFNFWQVTQRGGNSFNRQPPAAAYFSALHGYGATWVRLSYDKWKPAGRDFLLGDADRYTGLDADDLAQLKATLDLAHAVGLKVVIAPLSLPGARWRQNNHGRFDGRLWQQRAWWEQAAAFWKDLAAALRDHPAIAAYNLINEPAPEFGSDLPEHAGGERRRDWQRKVAGSARDLPAFYNHVIAALRTSDAVTPVMVDAGWYASAAGFDGWPQRLADDKVLYSFHMYEPYAATSAPNMKRSSPYRYPGRVPFGGKPQHWDAATVAAHLRQPLAWAARHGIAKRQLVLGEFGCMRRWPDCRDYLEDVLHVAETEDLHWAFYSFREDAWDGMDYELGRSPVPWAYWQALEQGRADPLPRKATEVFEPIRKRLLRP
ncbi:glycoside hydrolase family 5 protein [Herbaspirillum autotrophicum]|uniref:glycoside hydrolase family 5 protein n=1 Tax=Herbaspirillum autotrophicum TaxID=180195 RepID=UPI0009F8F41D|nr:cellulase family glycosylhydrolase [Herbaspirillum autotrophicum]